QRVPHQIVPYVVSDPTKSTLYAPFENMLDIIPAAEQARLRADAKAAITTQVTPAYREFQQYFDHEYLPHCRRDPRADGAGVQTGWLQGQLQGLRPLPADEPPLLLQESAGSHRGLPR